MFSYNSREKKGTTKYDNRFWDKLIKVLFIFGVVIVLLTIASKWLGFLD